MKTLRPAPLVEQDYADIEAQLQVIFYNLIFKPLVDLLSPHNHQVKKAARELRNAVVAPVIAGIRSGKIQYSKNTFSGNFNSEISKALKSYGANYNKRQGTFTIMHQDLPLEVLAAVNEYADAAKKLHDKLAKTLDAIQMQLEFDVKDHPVHAVKTVNGMEKKFNKVYGEAIGKEELSDRAKNGLAKGYTDNMMLWIKNFSKETIQDLRGAVEENAAKGYRFDHLVDKIQNRYDVSKTKAAFLARQETSLFVSKHRQERFAEVGITSYVWQTAGDATVRTDHKHLNGQTFEYAKPPIVDVATGRRANPGEDYNCRCVANPILPGVLANV